MSRFLCVSDDHADLKAARAAVSGDLCQRCQFYLQQNAGHVAPTKALRELAAADIRAIFDAPDAAENKQLIDRFIRTCETKAPKFAEWPERPFPKAWRCWPTAPSPPRAAYVHVLSPYVSRRRSPMYGNSLCQDYRFLAPHMPQLEVFFITGIST
ncbi:transposase [Salinisphaera sp. Q1T1-3]|uniref:transposase n=1 Tax=Salinisphaera sp. Q1T1-3 TaxID=2321229 RepID=UPI000E726938|nr:transposase [Salinisphaera sp. Q1T1-3]RJS92660.1 hypothetical protein D3260_10515 [Salinisphaera sp. Q1T1-3]